MFELPHNPSLTFCQLSLTMPFFISSVQSPIFETEYNTGNLVSVLKVPMENDYSLPKITSVTPLKESRVVISLHNIRVALVPLNTVYKRGNIL